MTDYVARSLSVEDIERYIREGLSAYVNKGPDTTDELLELGEGYRLAWVPPAVKAARRQRANVDEGEKLAEGFATRAAEITRKLDEVAGQKPAAPAQPKPKPEPELEEKEAATAEPKPQEKIWRRGAPKPETAKPEAKPAPIRRAKPEKGQPTIGWPADWPEPPLPPASAQGIERLTYPRGLLGHAVQYVVDTSALPHRVLALATALSALAKGLDRKVIGPSGNSTILYNLVIAETGAGKQQGISCCRSLLRAMGLERCVAASALASIQAIEEIIEGNKVLEPNPNALIVIDEVGSWLSRILSGKQVGNVYEIPGHLQSLWAWPLEEPWMGTKRLGKEMKNFYAVAFSILGFSTERMFFAALEDKHINSGFVNRMILWDVGRGAPERVDTKYDWTQCPGWLVKALKQVTSLEAAPLDARMKLVPTKDGQSVVLRDFYRISWGPGAKELWHKFETEVRGMPSVEDRELWIRAHDIAVRLATIVAVYRCSPTVDVEDWNWAVELAKHSTKRLKDGADAHMREQYKMADLVEFLRKKFRAKGVLTIGEINKLCENKVDDFRKIRVAINHLVECRDIVELDPSDRPGRPTTKWKWKRWSE